MRQNRHLCFWNELLGSFRSINRSRSWCFKIFRSRSWSLKVWSRSRVEVWKMWLCSSLVESWNRGEHGQDQDWISCRILAIFSDQDWIWTLIFEKNWIRAGSGHWFDFCSEIFLRVIQDVTKYGGSVFFTKVFILCALLCCTHHNQRFRVTSSLIFSGLVEVVSCSCW